MLDDGGNQTCFWGEFGVDEIHVDIHDGETGILAWRVLDNKCTLVALLQRVQVRTCLLIGERVSLVEDKILATCSLSTRQLGFR